MRVSSSRRAQDDAEMAALPQVVFESNSILNGIQFVLQDTTEDDYTTTYFSNTAFRVSIKITVQFELRELKPIATFNLIFID